MIRAVLALLLFVVIAGFSGEARAHAGMAGHGAVVVSGAAAADNVASTGDAFAIPVASERSPGHLPAGKCCMTAAGCGNAGSLLAGVPPLPVPGQVAAVHLQAAVDAPRSLDPPVADRPPRSA